MVKTGHPSRRKVAAKIERKGAKRSEEEGQKAREKRLKTRENNEG